MADGLVAWQAQAADDVSGGTDKAFLCGVGQEGSELQLPATSFKPVFARTEMIAFSEFYLWAESREKMSASKSLSNEEPGIENRGPVSF